MLALINGWPWSAALWLFPLAMTAHMLEESIWLPRWSQKAGAWHQPVTKGEFGIASLILIVFVFGLTYWAARSRPESLAVYLLLGLAFLMLLNIFYPHLGSAVTTGVYAPGLATAILFILPVMSYLLARGFREHYVSWKPFFGAAVVVVIAAAFIWPALFWVGRRAISVFH